MRPSSHLCHACFLQRVQRLRIRHNRPDQRVLSCCDGPTFPKMISEQCNSSLMHSASGCNAHNTTDAFMVGWCMLTGSTTPHCWYARAEGSPNPLRTVLSNTCCGRFAFCTVEKSCWACYCPAQVCACVRRDLRTTTGVTEHLQASLATVLASHARCTLLPEHCDS